MQEISVVVPVYGSALSLTPLIERLEPVLTDHFARFEVILVNDSSPDHSAEVIATLISAHPWVRAITMMRNYGQHNALVCGIRHARFELIATMDDDLQHPPEELPKLIDALSEDLDVIYGTPAHAKHNLWRNLASKITKLVLQSTMGAQTASHVSAFRVFRTRLRDAFAQYQGPFANLDVLLTWGTTKFKAVPVRHDPRTIGESNYTFKKLVTHALNMMTGFSVVPLQAASVLGFLCALLGLLLLCYVLGRYILEGGSVPGFPFLASVIVIFSGAQLLCLGIFGEYLARMHFRLMDRPTYVIKSTSEPQDD